MEKLVIKSSRWRYALLLLGSVAFVATGVLMLYQGNWFGWAAVLFFGAGIAVSAWQLLDSRPRLVIDERGVVDRTLGVGRIEWRDVEGAQVFSISGNDFISLRLRDPEKYLSRLSKVRRALATANRKIGLTDFSLNLSGVAADTDEVFGLVLKFCELSRRGEAEEPRAPGPGWRDWPPGG